MHLEKPAISTQLVLSLSLDETQGVLAITTAHAPPVNLRTSLGYKLSRDEARQLAAALTTWAGAEP